MKIRQGYELDEVAMSASSTGVIVTVRKGNKKTQYGMTEKEILALGPDLVFGPGLAEQTVLEHLGLQEVANDGWGPKGQEE